MFQNTKQVILKVTRGCNLRCKYCYVFHKDDYNEESMSYEIFNQVLRKWFQETTHGRINSKNEILHSFLLRNEETEQKNINWRPLSLIFHGGEPLKIGKEKFSAFCKIATQIARDEGVMLQLGLQTNGTLIDDEWIGIFRRYNIIPGISFDGFDESDDNRHANKTLINNIINLRGYGLTPGLIMIAHKQNYKDIISNLTRLQSLGFNSIKINRAVDVDNVGGFELTAEENLELSKKIIQFMFDNSNFVEQTLYDKMKKYIENISFGQLINVGDACYTRYCGAGNSIIEIEPDGNMLFCGRNSERSDLVSSGHVSSMDVAELIHTHKMWKFHKAKAEAIVDRKCNLCSAQTFCDYGCLSFSYQKYGKGIIDDVTCDFNKSLIQFFNENRNKIYDKIKGDIKNESYFNYFM